MITLVQNVTVRDRLLSVSADVIECTTPSLRRFRVQILTLSSPKKKMINCSKLIKYSSNNSMVGEPKVNVSQTWDNKLDNDNKF